MAQTFTVRLIPLDTRDWLRLYIDEKHELSFPSAKPGRACMLYGGKKILD